MLTIFYSSESLVYCDYCVHALNLLKVIARTRRSNQWKNPIRNDEDDTRDKFIDKRAVGRLSQMQCSDVEVIEFNLDDRIIMNKTSRHAKRHLTSVTSLRHEMVSSALKICQVFSLYETNAVHKTQIFINGCSCMHLLLVFISLWSQSINEKGYVTSFNLLLILLVSNYIIIFTSSDKWQCIRKP